MNAAFLRMNWTLKAGNVVASSVLVSPHSFPCTFNNSTFLTDPNHLISVLFLVGGDYDAGFSPGSNLFKQSNGVEGVIVVFSVAVHTASLDTDVKNKKSTPDLFRSWFRFSLLFYLNYLWLFKKNLNELPNGGWK